MSLSVKISGLPLGASSSRATAAERSALGGCATVVRTLAPGGELAMAGLRVPCGFASVNGASVRDLDTEGIRAACEAARGPGLVLAFALPPAGVTFAGLNPLAGGERAAAAASPSAPATIVRVDDGDSSYDSSENSDPCALVGLLPQSTKALKRYSTNHSILRHVPFPLVVFFWAVLGCIFALWLPVLLPAGLALSTLSPEHSLLALALCPANSSRPVRSGAAITATGQFRAISVTIYEGSGSNLDELVIVETLPLLTPMASSPVPLTTPLTDALVDSISASDFATKLFGLFLITPMLVMPTTAFLFTALVGDEAAESRPAMIIQIATQVLCATGCFVTGAITISTTASVSSAAGDWARGHEPLQEAARINCISPASATLELVQDLGGEHVGVVKTRFAGAGIGMVVGVGIGLAVLLQLQLLKDEDAAADALHARLRSETAARSAEADAANFAASTDD